MSRARDPLTIPLSGLHLIEASAGTGKTYTIAHLVLRLVVEVGLPLERILVLTFTKAATEELRGRIALRLRQALETHLGMATEDPVLAAWVGSFEEPDLAQSRLESALADLDRAAIHTIHGFCQRVLRDMAFESGAPFDTELITDEQALRQAAAQDFWRRRMGAADEAEAAWLIRELPGGPESLLDRLKGALGPAAPVLVPLDPEALSDGLAALASIHQRLRDTWAESRAGVSALLANRSLSQTSYKPASVAQALVQMDSLCAGPTPSKLPDRLRLFTPGKLRDSTKRGQETPTHPFFQLCGALADLDLEAINRARRAALLASALDFIRGELTRRKRERRVIYFDDLLTDTAQALAGPQGPSLAARIRARFPQALIDEFQDTDLLQYRILSAVYGDALERDPGLGLYLIGDPKQAIYAFRGADVFTYMKARREARARDRGRIHTLQTNRRSASGLVEAINQWFGRAQAPFVFSGDIDFTPVKAAPNADAKPLHIGGRPATPLVFRWLPLAQGKTTRDGRRLVADSARELAVTDCARQIAALLGGTAQLGDRELRAADIAVLVRSHRDGLLVRDALTQVGICSVSIGQETVFETSEAEDLAALISALQPGASESALRTALATRPLGWSAEALAGRGAGAAAAWDRVLRDFDGYRRLWQERGFMAALAALIHGLEVPARLRRGPEGERRLTNLLHLVELAQEASREHPGPEALGRWLADRRAHAEASGDAALLRLESDANLVQVVTFHKSKGLEYPVVLIPMPWSGAPRSDPDRPVTFHDPETLEPRLDLGSPRLDHHRRLADREDLAERLRLLYVALTRAKRQCIIHWGPVNQAEGSAAAYLLHQGHGAGGEPLPAAERVPRLTDAEMREDLEALVRSEPGSIAITDLEGNGPSPTLDAAAVSEPLSPAQFGGTIPDDWHILSFSALTPGQETRQEPERPDHDALPIPLEAAAPELVEPELVDPGQDTQDPDAQAADGPPRAGAETGLTPTALAVESIFRFPRGIRAGHCLHDLLEHLDFRDAQGPGLEREVQAAMARHGIEPQWAPTLVELVGRVLDTPLTPEGLRLRGLAPEDRRTELEFHFALEGLEPPALQALLARHGVPAQVQLPPRRLSGLMKGFVDLVLRFEGRFYVVDYKSNHLGDRVDDYAPPALARAMTEHHYHLQSLIYTLALHRYLRARLPGYDCERHLGGSLYLFLRGMRPPLGATRGVHRTRPERTLIEDLDRVFSAAGGARS
ncbi:MAG: exodeoxyribonuclease V subunit beta [Bdellovibrio bacteriovorus]